MRLIYTFLALAGISLGFASFGFAQQCPELTSLAQGDTGWPSNSTPVIYVVDPNGSDLASVQNSILGAFNNWKSGVQSVQSYSVQVVSSPPAFLSTYSVIVQRGSTAACGSGKSGCTTITDRNSYGQTLNTTINIDPSMPLSGMAYLMAHEAGHTYGFADCDLCGGTVMNPDVTNQSPTGPTNCDDLATYTLTNGAYGEYNPNCAGFQPPSCASGTVPDCSQGVYGCTAGCPGSAPEPCCDECYEACEDHQWVCVGSPITLDIYGRGFHFTDMSHGVQFRVLPNDKLRQMSWPEASSRNAWLALDRNGDGQITDMTELFGNATPQPPSSDPNGYLALAVFDEPENGGNGNGYIDPGDAIYKHLLVWIDENHNGISEPNELHSLQEAGVFKIDLKYRYSRYVDENGNVFRYKSKVEDKSHDRVCYDVFVSISN